MRYRIYPDCTGGGQKKMNTKKYKDNENKEWICTDPDQYQYCHIISPTVYEYKQKWGFKKGWCRSIIDLSDFTEGEVRGEISYFYSSIEELQAVAEEKLIQVHNKNMKLFGGA